MGRTQSPMSRVTGVVSLLSLLIGITFADIHQAIKGNDLKGVKAAVKAGELNLKSATHHTPLMAAVLADDRSEIAEYLISAGANRSISDSPDGINANGYAPIHAAGFKGRSVIMAALVEAGGDANQKHMDGFTPLHRALWGTTAEHADTVEVLVEKCGKICAGTAADDEDSSWQIALDGKNPESITIMKAYLTKHKLSMKLKTVKPQTAEEIEYEKIFKNPEFIGVVQRIVGEFKIKQGSLPAMLMSLAQTPEGLQSMKDPSKLETALRLWVKTAAPEHFEDKDEV